MLHQVVLVEDCAALRVDDVSYASSSASMNSTRYAARAPSSVGNDTFFTYDDAANGPLANVV